MALLDIFVGVPQSKYAGMAIMLALVVVAFAILFGKEQVPVGQKFLFILIMFLVALPSILLSLFQLTCLVTGSGFKNKRWWCGAYAWIGTFFILIYSAIIVVVGVMSLINGTDVRKEIDQMMTYEMMQGEANKQAQEFFENRKATEGFTDMKEEETETAQRDPPPPAPERKETVTETFGTPQYIDPKSVELAKMMASSNTPAPATTNEHFTGQYAKVNEMRAEGFQLKAF
jgi:hypothetical protein